MHPREFGESKYVINDVKIHYKYPENNVFKWVDISVYLAKEEQNTHHKSTHILDIFQLLLLE